VVVMRMKAVSFILRQVTAEDLHIRAPELETMGVEADMVQFVLDLYEQFKK